MEFPSIYFKNRMTLLESNKFLTFIISYSKSCIPTKLKGKKESIYMSKSKDHDIPLYPTMGTTSQYSNNFSHNDSITPYSSSQNQHSFVQHHQCISTFKGHTSHISSLTITQNFLYSGSSNKEIRVFTLNSFPNTPQPNNLSTIHTNFLLKTGKGAIKSLVISDSKLFSAHQDHKIRVFEIHNSHENQDFKLLTTLPTLTDRLLRFFPPKNHVQIRRHKRSTWVHHVDTVSALALSSDNSVLYSVSWDRTMKIWQTSDFRCLESITNAHDDAINALALSNNGFVYTGSADKKIKVWSKGDDHHGEKKNKKKKRKHSLLATLEKHKSVINALVISVDGSNLYSGGCDCMVLVWKIDDNLNSMDVVCELRGHRRAILCLGVVSDLICSGSADNSVRIWRRNRWDRSGYSCLSVLEGHRGPVKCLAAVATDDDYHDNNYSSTSVLVYSGSVDCDIKVWKISVPSF